jgi:chromosomal replication initiation ATPase DnaA
MSTLTQRDVQHIFEALRKGLVPERGIDTFAEGIDKPRSEIHRQLELASSGEGTIKFLRGGYGCGKTFMARLAALDAQARASRPASSSSPTTTCTFTASTTSTARS